MITLKEDQLIDAIQNAIKKAGDPKNSKENTIAIVVKVPIESYNMDSATVGEIDITVPLIKSYDGTFWDINKEKKMS